MMSTSVETLADEKPIDLASIRFAGASWEGFRLEPDACFVSFLNRPFVHHLIESLVDRGVTRFDFICDRSVERYADALGNGERWGASFRFRAANEGASGDGGHPFSAHALPFSSSEETGTKILRIDTPDHYLDAQRCLMDSQLAAMLTLEQEVLPGVWTNRNVSIHPTARLSGPILIGENSRISAGVSLGPHTVIGPNCFVDRNTTIEHSTVLPNVYVGEGLDARRLVISSSSIRNVRLSATVRVQDDLLVGRFPW